MKAIDVYKFFISRADWIDLRDTVDKIIIGNPDKDIKTIMVTWISSFNAIKTAVEQGFDMLITHEPTFWVHENEDKVMDRFETGIKKKKYIEENNLVILRCHDVWDRMPDIGIPWAWAKFLGFAEKPAKISSDNYQHRYDIEPVSLDAFAQRISEKTAKIREPLIQVCGQKDQMVSKIGIGTGCACSIELFQQMGCDLSIVCDDGTWYWQHIQYAIDSNHPVIRVNHGTSEEPGMVTLTEYINDNLPDIKVEHLPFRTCFRLVE